MGKRPCRRRAARLTAGALLALQISFIALASDGNAEIGAANSPVAAVIADRPATSARVPETGLYDVNALEAARRYTRDLYRQAIALGEVTDLGTSLWEREGLSEARRPVAETPARRGQARVATRAAHRLPLVLAHAQAAQLLKQAGLRRKSSGRCASRDNGRCTSLEAVRTETVNRVIGLKRESGCPVVITGGTEVGHAPGLYSHYGGYKLDIKPNRCISRHIKSEYPHQGTRGDGAPLYGDSQTVYAREPDHWDILFR
ncbi:hypothetical protein ACFQ08_05500 [Streptosporangium algeriense]|uniref:Peptidase M15B domain-containing protein n=1 Tax=Streptosporangium algeriense TaxID=1682748 RepID=A0ABW3DLD0_9ACTN